MQRFNKTSKAAMLHPYQRDSFWLDEKNHFWETDSYTENGKEYCRNIVKQIKENTQNDKTTILNRNHL